MHKFLLTVTAAAIAIASNAQTNRRQLSYSSVNKTTTRAEYSKYYLKAGVGYALPQSGQVSGTEGVYSGSVTLLQSGRRNFDVKPASFSAGISGTVSGGKMLNKHVGIELGINIGLSNTAYSVSYFHDTVNAIPGTTTWQTQAKRPILVMPSILLQTGGEKINIYSSFGVVLPVYTRVEQDISFTNDFGTGAKTTYVSKWMYKYDFSMGYKAAIGINTTKDRTNFFAELNFISLALKTKQAQMTEYSINGQTGNSRGSYVSQLGNPMVSYSYSVIPDNTTGVAYAMPFSNVGITLGVKYNF